MKLAIIYTDLSLGGIQRKIVDILNYIERSKYKQTIQSEIILRWKTEFNLIPNLCTRNTPIYYPPRIYPFPRRRMSFLFNIVRRLLANPPDVILTHVFGSSFRTIPFARIVWGNRIKIVISQDNIFSMENREWYARMLVPWIYPMADKIIVQTQISKNDLVGNWQVPEHKVEVIPNWSRDIPYKRCRRDIDIVYCGRFEEQKNLIRLMRICKTLVKRKPDLKVVIIGSGRQETMLRNYVDNNALNHSITFISPVNSIDDYLYRSKIFALTSKFEGQPMALLEAMSSGCVPIITNFPGSKEYITHEYNGLVARSNPEYVNHVLACLSSNSKRLRLAKNAQAIVKKKYSQKNIQRYIDLLTE